ncbi:hypothetical protein PO909_000817, partial [Leuciscus waleckii]
QNNGNINIVLLGKTGVGKSSSGNTILGEDRFRCGRSLSAVTDISSVEKSEINGRAALQGVCEEYVSLRSFGRFTEQEEEILTKVQKVYGKDVLRHVIILFTYGDECDRENMQEEIDGNPIVQRVVEKCQDYHVLNNRDLNNREQVNDLLLKIDTMMEWNKGFYTNEMYEWAQKTTWEQFWKILKDFFNAVIAFFQNLSKSFDYSYCKETLRL